MNHFEWMDENVPGKPMIEPDSRQDPDNRPKPPTDVDPDASPNVSIKDPRMVAETNVPDEDLESSNESIVADVRKFFGVHNRGKDYNPVDGRNFTHYSWLEKQLKETFANPAWLKKQTPVKNSISAKDISDKLNVSNPTGSVTEAFSIYNSIENARLEAEKKVYSSLKAGLDIIAQKGKLSDEAYDTLKQNVAQAKSVDVYYKGPAKPSAIPKDSAESIEPLTIEAIGELARQIAGVMAKCKSLEENEENAVTSISKALGFDWFQQYIWDGDEDVKHNEPDSSYSKDAWITLGHNIQGLVTGPHAATLAERQLNDAIVGAIILMERSIKGGAREVSNEEFTVAIEGIFDKLLGRFTKSGGNGDEDKAPPKVNVDYLKELRRFVEQGPDTLGATKCTDREAPYMAGIATSTKDWAGRIRKDIKGYESLVEKALAYDKQITAWENRFADQLDSFMGDADRPEDFAAFLKKYADAEPKPWLDVMPKSKDFIAYTDGSWGDDEDGFDRQSKPETGTAFDIPAQDKKDTDEIKKVLKELVSFADRVDTIYYPMDGHGADFTDPPYRGYSKDDECIEQMNRFRLHAHVDNNPVDMFGNLANRLYTMLCEITKVLIRAEGKSTVSNESVDDIVISNEGVFDALGKIFGGKPRAIKVEFMDDGLITTFEKTILNNAWLEKQEFADDVVSVQFPKAAPKGDYTKLANDVKAELKRVAKVNLAATEKWFNRVKEEYMLVSEARIEGLNYGRLESIEDKLLDEAEEMNIPWQQPKMITEPLADMELPALDKAGVQKAARTIIDLIETLQRTNDEASEGIPPLKSDRRAIMNASDVPQTAEDVFVAARRVRDDSVELYYHTVTGPHELVNSLAKALTRWISKSLPSIKYEG